MSFIKNYNLLARSLDRKTILDLIETAFVSIQPESVIKKNMSFNGNLLRIQSESLTLSYYKRVFLLGIGKGSATNSKIIEDILGNNLTKGFVIDVVGADFKKIEFTKGTHPLPSQANLDFTKKVIGELKNLSESDLVIIVTCGGGSALFELPNNLSLDALIKVDKALLTSGADIKHMNVIRKHISSVKGGKLAKILYPAKVINLIFSDVPGNDFSTIASGPTVKDASSLKEAQQVFRKYSLDKVIREADLEDTPKDDMYFKGVKNILMLSNLTALGAMQNKAQNLGHKARVYSHQFESDANSAAKKLINETKVGEILLIGGETTVDVKGKGEGGRNQQLVLSALCDLPKNTVIASFDSDGWDNSPAAGAIADELTLENVKDKNINLEEFLDRNNSYPFFQSVGDAILTGRLPSNVSDLMIVYKK